MKSNRIILLAAYCLITLSVVAAPRSKEQMKNAAAQAINKQRSGKKMAPRKASELKVLKTTDSYEIIGNEQGGFAVIAADDLLPEVLGVSTSNYSNGQNTNFQWWLTAMNQVASYAVQHQVKMNTTKPDPTKYPTSVGPLMTTKWDQDEPYNDLLPQSIYGGRCITGCVATAMAQVLNYFQVPECGIGTRTIYYPQGSSSGTAITANFGEHVYDWDNMLDEYTYGNYNEAQVNAVATLMRDCGVAADMEYGGSNSIENGSGAYSQEAAAGLRTYFGIAEAECLERDDYSESAWMDIVYRSLSEDGPVYYGGASYSSGGHAFVLHGYREDGKVYVNWGWSGDDDGYYDIALLNPGYYHFDMGQDMIIGVKGAPRNLTEESVELTKAGTLNSKLGDDMIGTVGTLKIKGDINSTDLRQIRRLAGIDENGEKTDGRLQHLDLSEANIVSGGKAYLIDGNKQLTTEDNVLAERAFYGCKYLKSIKLPKGLKTWGEGALALCLQLTDVEVGTPAADADFKIVDAIVWNNAQDEIIAVLPSVSGSFDIAKGTKSLHNYALAGCARLSKVVLPASLKTLGTEALRNCSGLQEIRVVSKEVPELLGADVFTGISLTSCQLYVPAGSKTKYAQKAQWGDFKGSNYDNIVEYGSSVKVRNTIRKYGEDNPKFVYVVSGDPITGEPVLSCEATRTTPAGKYPVTISLGTITDENVELFDGYIVIQKVNATATVENATREAGQPNPEFSLIFDGLVNDEVVPVWLEEPVFTCEADENSPEGEYPITVTATAESYKLTFVAGTLTVTPSTTGIVSVNADAKTKSDVIFDLSGRRVSESAMNKGLYIRNGKKFVRK